MVIINPKHHVAIATWSVLIIFATWFAASPTLRAAVTHDAAGRALTALWVAALAILNMLDQEGNPMSKTYHDRRHREARRSDTGAVHHEHGPEKVCQYCGKINKGGARKRERAALLDGLSDLRPANVLRLMAEQDIAEDFEPIDFAYPYE